MSRFPTASHLAAWAGLAPGNYQSAGKRLSGKTRKGNQTLRSGLMQSAHVASRSRTYLAAQYRLCFCNTTGDSLWTAISSALTLLTILAVRSQHLVLNPVPALR